MFTLKIKTDNDAFQASPMEALAEMLRIVAVRLDARQGANYAPNFDGNIHDVNGNLVGKFSYKG